MFRGCCIMSVSIVKHEQRQRVQRTCMGEDENTCMRQDDRPDKSQKASKVDNRKPKISFFPCLFISFLFLFYFYRMHFSKIVVAKISFRFDYTIKKFNLLLF